MRAGSWERYGVDGSATGNARLVTPRRAATRPLPGPPGAPGTSLPVASASRSAGPSGRKAEEEAEARPFRHCSAGPDGTAPRAVLERSPGTRTVPPGARNSGPGTVSRSGTAARNSAEQPGRSAAPQRLGYGPATATGNGPRGYDFVSCLARRWHTSTGAGGAARQNAEHGC